MYTYTKHHIVEYKQFLSNKLAHHFFKLHINNDIKLKWGIFFTEKLSKEFLLVNYLRLCIRIAISSQCLNLPEYLLIPPRDA